MLYIFGIISNNSTAIACNCKLNKKVIIFVFKVWSPQIKYLIPSASRKIGFKKFILFLYGQRALLSDLVSLHDRLMLQKECRTYLRLYLSLQSHTNQCPTCTILANECSNPHIGIYNNFHTVHDSIYAIKMQYCIADFQNCSNFEIAHHFLSICIPIL